MKIIIMTSKFKYNSYYLYKKTRFLFKCMYYL